MGQYSTALGRPGNQRLGNYVADRRPQLIATVDE
jgi:hypothetical protein